MPQDVSLGISAEGLVEVARLGEGGELRERFLVMGSLGLARERRRDRRLDLSDEDSRGAQTRDRRDAALELDGLMAHVEADAQVAARRALEPARAHAPLRGRAPQRRSPHFLEGCQDFVDGLEPRIGLRLDREDDLLSRLLLDVRELGRGAQPRAPDPPAASSPRPKDLWLPVWVETDPTNPFGIQRANSWQARLVYSARLLSSQVGRKTASFTTFPWKPPKGNAFSVTTWSPHARSSASNASSTSGSWSSSVAREDK